MMVTERKCCLSGLSFIANKDHSCSGRVIDGNGIHPCQENCFAVEKRMMNSAKKEAEKTKITEVQTRVLV